VNSGKKAMNETKQSKKKTKDNIPAGGIGKRIGAGIIILLLAAVIGIVAWEGLAPKYLLSVNGEKLSKKDLMYDFYQTELIGSQMASLYSQFGYTQDYWNMDNGDGTTTQDTLKSQTIENYLYNRIIYAEAVAKGYEATEDEKTQAAETAAQSIEELTADKASKLGLTKDLLTEKALEELVVSRYKTDTVESLNINDDEIKAGVDYDTYRGYSVQYFFAPTTTTNDAGETEAVADKTSMYSELKTVLEKAKDSNDWSKVVDSKDEDAVVSYKKSILTAKDETFSEDIMKKIVAMGNGDVSEIVEAEDGYYVFRMVDNNDPSKYDKAVEDAITEAEDAGFNEVYAALKANYKIKEYDTNWRNIVFGTVTLG